MARAEASPLRPSTVRISTLKHRSDFLSTRKGARCARPAFVLEGKRRADSSASGDVARFGFTVSKKVGGAVERNRIKRRLKAAVRDVVRKHARADFDYVLIARRSAIDSSFAVLVSDLVKALDRVNGVPPPRDARRAASA